MQQLKVKIVPMGSVSKSMSNYRIECIHYESVITCQEEREIDAKVVKENRHMSADAEIKGDRQSTRIKRPNVLAI